MRHIRKFIPAVLFLTALMPGQSDPNSRAWNQPVKPFRIIGNLYYVGASDVTSFLITTAKGHILLDGGLPETAPQIERNVATLGFRMKDVKFLLNSHAHFDHAGGLAELKRVSGARMVASAEDAPALTSGDRDDFAWGSRVRFPGVSVDRVARDGQSVTLGSTTLTAHITPGHTKGCTTWSMPVSVNSKSYNVVFVCSASVPGYRLVGNKKYPNMVADYKHTFQTLRRLPCDIFLAAHGSFFGLKEKHEALERGKEPNPFIDPVGYRAYVDRAETDFRKRLAERTRKAS